jgi:hypothetical protein
MLVVVDMAENAGRPASIRKAAIYPNLSSPTGYRFKKIKNVANYEGEEAGVWQEQEAQYRPGENVPTPEQIEQFRRESPEMARRLEQETKRLANLEAAPAPALALPGGANHEGRAVNRGGIMLNLAPQGEAVNFANMARKRVEAARKRMLALPVNHNEVPLGGAGAAADAAPPPAAGAAGAAADAAPPPAAGAAGAAAPPGLASLFAARGENVGEFESEWARYAEKKGGRRKAKKSRKARKARRSTRKQRRASRKARN